MFKIAMDKGVSAL